MIYYVSTERFSSTIRSLIHGLGRDAHGRIGSLTYEELFFEQALPIGHYVFTDFDRLSRYELDSLGPVIRCLRSAIGVRILNDPAKALERVPLLARLHREGVNDFEALRIDTGDRPSRYPVFIRAEDGYGGAETDVLGTVEEYDAALAEFSGRGMVLKGRIAVGYVGERDDSGFFRKYGAFNVGGRIIPQHLMFGDEWVVKKRSSLIGENQIANELRYVQENPHAEELRRVFERVGIDFGRIDYGFYRGRLQVYEINTNPSFPKFGKADLRSERRVTIRKSFVEALDAINSPHSRGRLRFSEVRPRAHDRRLPKTRFFISVGRRLADHLLRRTSPEPDA